MSIGMTYDEFWNQDVAMVRAYRKAHELKRRQQNETLWMQGLYVRDALLATVGNMFADKSSKKNEYPTEPYPVTVEQIAEKLNYSSVFSFSKAFKEKYGVSPKNYYKQTL